ncbi:MAG: HAD family hydrolase [Anaerolineaceae bacterium]
MIRNIIWDVDGTLFDTYPAFSYSFQLALKDLGYDMPLDWITQQARISIDFCVKALAERCQVDENIIGVKFDKFYSSTNALDQPPFEDVIEICNFIMESGGKNLIVTHRRAEGLIELLDTFNMRQYFSGWTTADDAYKRKPDPEAFLVSIAKHNLNPGETLAVGDRDIDILAGQAAGLEACLFGDPLPNCQPDLIVQNFAQLLAWIEKSR